ncbi:hypothetical protein [Paraburkholderia sediminicola]|uniref:hypothetical protein n=1 Tax=Paraburkholderia sediminicola TaxID=458836 RepID=UPI0038BD36D5
MKIISVQFILDSKISVKDLAPEGALAQETQRGWTPLWQSTIHVKLAVADMYCSHAMFLILTWCRPARYAISGAGQYSKPLQIASREAPFHQPGFGRTAATVSASFSRVVSEILFGFPVSLQEPKA